MNALEPGSTLGGYKILARLRAGAMGSLYLARRNTAAGFSRPVAIKVIHDHLAQNKRFCRMFVDEAKLAARIDDPNVVRVDEFGQADDRYYLVMEYVHGASLAQTIGVLKRRGGIPMDHAVAIAMQIASGLHGAHEATDEDGAPLGVVHRDVSPHNIVVSYKGSVRVVDFGIAKAKQVGGQTKTGSLRGKLAYMPPEQARSARTVDRRADLYGVGLILWEMLTGRRVFDAETDIAILNQIREPDIVPPSRLMPKVPQALDVAVMRMLAQDPNGRPRTGAELQRELATAMPTALRVLAGDLATLMSTVRAAADAAAAAGVADDDAAMYGHELRRDVVTFGASMRSIASDVDDVLATRPSRPELEDHPSGPSLPHGGSVPPLPAPPPGPSRPPPSTLLRPADGVRPLAPPAPSPSSPSLGPMRPSYASVPPAHMHDAFVTAPTFASGPPNAHAHAPLAIAPPIAPKSNTANAADAPMDAAALKAIATSKPFLMGVAVALGVAFFVLLAVMAIGRAAPEPTPGPGQYRLPGPAKTVGAVAAPTIVAPVVIAPPPTAVPELVDAAVPVSPPRTRR